MLHAAVLLLPPVADALRKEKVWLKGFDLLSAAPAKAREKTKTCPSGVLESASCDGLQRHCN